MATLNEKTHARITAYEQYILRNTRNWDKLELVIDKKVKGTAPVYNAHGTIVKNLGPGRPIGKLRSKNLYKVTNIPSPKGYESSGHCLATTFGYISIFDISKPIVRKDVMEIEFGVIARLDRAIKSLGPNRLYINNEVYFDGARGASKVSGTPKADFIISTDRSDVFISHKGGSSPSSFSQLSGLSKKSGMQNKETNDFLIAVAQVVANNGKLPYMVYRPIKDFNILNMAVFGPDYKKGKYGVNNCNMIAQGNPLFSNYKDGIKLDWTGHMVYNNDKDIKFFTAGDWTLVLGAFNSMGMHIIIDGVKLASNVRTGIYTIAKLKTSRSREI